MEVLTDSMNVMLVSIGAIVLYTVGMVCQWGRITGRGGARNVVLLATTLGAVLHTFSLYFAIHTGKGTNLGILTISSLTTLMVTLVVLLSSLRKPSESLLVMILPFTIISVLAAWLAPVEHIFRSPTLMVVHVLLSVLAYGLLMVAVCQSLLLAYQEKQLRSHNQKRLLKALPPLQTMEKLLFEFLSVGVVLLTLSLISGFIYIDDMFAKEMLHKTVLSLVAWVLFSTLLIGHWVNGWRGQKAMRWTVAGFVLLLVAYFGWRTVVDFILVR
ncbi:cytochrome C assembly family protein [Endozoicomonas arenosclerae]|uniref:cytochrome C assembly family protein n=1 Tax=Endozoicomonas arenosclerae TaxID=1633495 RepID=UPI000A6D8218|nr:cytochrome c biogenesis protein CcsA [Endozoicomonas arenosclerae]